MVRNFALRFVFFIGLACALGGSKPAQAVFADNASLYSQVQLVLNGFTERVRAGGSTTDGFLKLDDVKGSSTNAAFKDQMPVLYSQGFITVTGGSGQAAQASPSDYYLVIPADQSGPVLQQAAASGSMFLKATITNLRADRGLQVVSNVDTLETVRVTFYMKTSTSVTAYPDVAIIGLGFAKATWAYGTVRGSRNFAVSANC